MKRKTWKHGGHHELAGTRQRYRLLNLGRLIRCLGHMDEGPDAFRQWYVDTLSEKLTAGVFAREPYWTEAFAVGARGWVEDIYERFGFQREKILAAPTPAPQAYPDSETTDQTELADGDAVYYIEG